VGFTIAVVAAVLSVLLLGPADLARFQPIQVEGNQELISEALTDYEANSTAAGEDLDLQVVANGWVARDFLYIVANELDAVSDQLTILSAQTDALANGTGADDRVPALLLVGVLTFAFHAATLPYAAQQPMSYRQRSASRRETFGYDVQDRDRLDYANDEES
jgi:hypothetical protein